MDFDNQNNSNNKASDTSDSNQFFSNTKNPKKQDSLDSVDSKDENLVPDFQTFDKDNVVEENDVQSKPKLDLEDLSSNLPEPEVIDLQSLNNGVISENESINDGNSRIGSTDLKEEEIGQVNSFSGTKNALKVFLTILPIFLLASLALAYVFVNKYKISEPEVFEVGSGCSVTCSNYNNNPSVCYSHGESGCDFSFTNKKTGEGTCKCTRDSQPATPISTPTDSDNNCSNCSEDLVCHNNICTSCSSFNGNESTCWTHDKCKYENNTCLLRSSNDGGEGGRSASTICSEKGGEVTDSCSADPNCKSNGGVCCNIGSVNNCCYGDSSQGSDGDCYRGGNAGVACSGNTITNNTTIDVIVRRFIGTSCPMSTGAGTKTTLKPGQSVSASCEQLEASGYCGVCNDDCGGTGGDSTPTPSPTPVAVSISGQVYCQNSGGTKYVMPGVKVEIYDDTTKQTVNAPTDANGNYTYSGIGAAYAIRIWTRITEGSLSNGQAYANLSWPPNAVSCNNASQTGCTQAICGTSNSSYEGCYLPNGSHSNFDFVFNNCEPAVIPPMSCSNLIVTNAKGTELDNEGKIYAYKVDNNQNVNFSYTAQNIGMTDLRMRKLYSYNTTTGQYVPLSPWGAWSTTSLATSTGTSGQINYTLPTLEPGIYEFSLATYDGTTNETCTKMCGTYGEEAGRIYKEPIYDSLCPTQKTYDSTMGTQISTECTNSCRTKIKVSPSTVQEPMSCSNFSLSKTSLLKGETLTITYNTNEVVKMSDIRIRKFLTENNKWSDWQGYVFQDFVATNSSTPEFNYIVQETPGLYELSVVTYNGTNDSSCTKMCSIFQDGTLYTEDDDYDGFCPTKKYYTPEMGNQTEECSNDCRMTFNILENIFACVELDHPTFVPNRGDGLLFTCRSSGNNASYADFRVLLGDDVENIFAENLNVVIQENQAVWDSFVIPEDAPSGNYKVQCRICDNNNLCTNWGKSQ